MEEAALLLIIHITMKSSAGAGKLTDSTKCMLPNSVLIFC